MSFIEDFLTSSLQWLIVNVWNLFITLIVTVVVYFFYKFSLKQINQFSEKGRIDEDISLLFGKILRWSSIFFVGVFFIAQFGIQIDVVGGLFVLAGGTVIGFAAMNTIGNAIGGVIIMISRPFRIGDRVFFNEKFADIEEIDLIYTRMKTTDNVIISIPNQKLIQTEIENYGKGRIVRRRHSITVGYEESLEKVEKTLLEAASQVNGVLNEPKPYVWITEFQNYAVQYTLYVFIRNLKRIQEMDSAVRKSIFTACELNGIDLKTPSLIQSIKMS